MQKYFGVLKWGWWGVNKIYIIVYYYYGPNNLDATPHQKIMV